MPSPGSTEMMLTPYLAAALRHAGHGSMGRMSPERPTRQMMMVLTLLPNLARRFLSTCPAVPARPIGTFSRTCHLECVLVAMPRMLPRFEIAMPEILYVQGLQEAFARSLLRRESDMSAFFLGMFVKNTNSAAFDTKTHQASHSLVCV